MLLAGGSGTKNVGGGRWRVGFSHKIRFLVLPVLWNNEPKLALALAHTQKHRIYSRVTGFTPPPSLSITAHLRWRSININVRLSRILEVWQQYKAYGVFQNSFESVVEGPSRLRVCSTLEYEHTSVPFSVLWSMTVSWKLEDLWRCFYLRIETFIRTVQHNIS